MYSLSEGIQSCLTLCDPMDCSLSDSSVHEIFPGTSTGVGCHFHLQRIFPIQGSNLGLPHCRQMLYHLSHQGSPLEPLDLWLFVIISPAANSSCLSRAPKFHLEMYLTINSIPFKAVIGPRVSI